MSYDHRVFSSLNSKEVGVSKFVIIPLFLCSIFIFVAFFFVLGAILGILFFGLIYGFLKHKTLTDQKYVQAYLANLKFEDMYE